MNRFALVFLPLFSFGFTLTLNSGIDEGKQYSVLHLQDEYEFSCKEEILTYDKKIYVCQTNIDITPKIDDKILSLVEIRFRKEDGKNKIYITPRANSRLMSEDEPLYSMSDVVPSNKLFSKHYSIIINPTLSEFDKQTNHGINFAPSFDDMMHPSVGALDLNKAPIETADSNDINLYLDIKKLYEVGRYEDVIKQSAIARQRYPGSIFASEFLLYRLRSLDRIFDIQDSFENVLPIDIANEGKVWLRQFVSDENYQEVLYLVSKAYLRQDMMSDANYNLDILINEHPNSSWTKEAILEFADKIYSIGRQKEAIKMYENVLYSANTLELASRAALSLVETSIDRSKFQDAKDYILKIINANQNYLLKNIAKSMVLAGVFHEKNMDDVASKIYEILLSKLKKGDEQYELALKNYGLSLINTNNVNLAYNTLKRYESEFKDGDYIAQVEQGLDRLFFELKEDNATKLNDYYNLLKEKYGKTEIGQKALKEQVALFLKNRQYYEILNLTSQIRDLNDTDSTKALNYAALMNAREMIRKDSCQTVVNLVENYDIKDGIDSKFKLFDCYMRLARYKAAYELASANILVPDMLDRSEWLVKLSSTLLKMEKFKDVVKVADDAIAIAATQEYADVSPVLFDRFNALIALNRINDAVATIAAIEQLRGNDFKVIETYDKIAEVMYNNNDFVNASIYAKKAIDMQERTRTDTFSPKIEFEYTNSLIKIEELNEALNATKQLLQTRLSPENRLRALNQIGEIYIKMKNNSAARPYLQECISSNFQSSWKSLCEGQLKIIE